MIIQKSMLLDLGNAFHSHIHLHNVFNFARLSFFIAHNMIANEEF